MSIPHNARSSIETLCARIEGNAKNIRLASAHDDADAILRDSQAVIEAAQSIQRTIANNTGDGPENSVFRGDS